MRSLRTLRLVKASSDQFGVDSGEGYEAILTATRSPLAPALLTYVNRRGHTVHVS